MTGDTRLETSFERLLHRPMAEKTNPNPHKPRRRRPRLTSSAGQSTSNRTPKTSMPKPTVLAAAREVSKAPARAKPVTGGGGGPGARKTQRGAPPRPPFSISSPFLNTRENPGVWGGFPNPKGG